MEPNGRGWIDKQQDCPEGELRGWATLIKRTEDVRKYSAEQGSPESEALESGIQGVTQRDSARPGLPKRKEFADKGAALYAKA